MSEGINIGGTNFADPKLGKSMKWGDFKRIYSKLLIGVTVQEAFRKLGGKVPTKKS